jgi:hypothetical protein
LSKCRCSVSQTVKIQHTSPDVLFPRLLSCLI